MIFSSARSCLALIHMDVSVTSSRRTLWQSYLVACLYIVSSTFRSIDLSHYFLVTEVSSYYSPSHLIPLTHTVPSTDFWSYRLAEYISHHFLATQHRLLVLHFLCLFTFWTLQFLRLLQTLKGK
jgi:hypothetical protein